jgi:hypothetical protein
VKAYIGLAAAALEARRNEVILLIITAIRNGDDVINLEYDIRRVRATILAGKSVALENVKASPLG